MILGGIIAIVIPLFFMGTVVISRLSGSLMDIFNKEAVLNSKNMAKIITATLEREMDYASALAVDHNLIELMSQKKYAAAMERLKTVHKRIKKDSLGILIIDADGFIRADISSDSLHMDISDRPYFLQAKDGSISIQGPIIARQDEQRQLMVIAAPVFKEKVFVGVLAIALDMRYLVAMTSSVRNGKTGYAYVVNNEGYAIIHPQKEVLFKENIHKQKGMQSLAGKLIKNETGSVAYTYKGVKKFAGFTHLALTGWNVVYCQNRDEIMMPVKAINNFVLLSGCLFLLLAIAIIVTVAFRISMPAQMSMDQFQKLLEHSEYAILIIGANRRISHVNPAAEKMLERRSKELIGTKPVLDNTNNTPPETIWGELRSGRIWSGNVVVNPNDPESLILAVTIIPVTDVSGNIESFLEVARDITQELKMQSRLAQSQKMEALGTIAGGIAHDFNNILSAIFAYTEFSLDVPGNPPETQKNLKSLLTASERASDLVNQILAFSRNAAQELRPLAPRLIIKEAVKMLRSTIPAEIELRTSIASDAMIMADPVQIHQIVVNICTNAAHAIKPNSGTIDVTLEDLVVDEVFAHSHPGVKPGNHILLKISDSGKGMEQEVVDRIFEPFFTTKPAGEGTGLGLSVVHGLVKKLGGIITVYSKTGEGTSFNIIIPAIPSQPQENGVSEAVCVGGTERILLIDDEQSIVEPIAKILTNLGYHVSMFTDSVKALDTFKQTPDAFDLVITDYSMPKMTGFEIARIIKELRNDIRIIVNSGYITQEIYDRFANIGVSLILKKPINKYQLADAIRKAFV
jgi:PAS domain S-box-containing protein